MKERKKESILRFLAFFAVLLLLLRFSNTFLLQTDAASFMMIHEMKESEGIELALVGSSVVRNQFNPELISQETGKNTFCAGIPCLALPGSLALTSMLYEESGVPEWTVLFLEHDTFFPELHEAEYRLMPQLTGPLRRLGYYLDLSTEDGRWLDRLFLFKNYHVSSAAQLSKTVALRLNADRYMQEHPGLVSGHDRYAGRGFVRMELTEDIDAMLRRDNLNASSFYCDAEPSARDRQRLLAYRDMCEKAGSRLLVIFAPNLTARSLAETNFLPLRESIAQFMAENDIPYYDFSLAKPELLPDLTDYYLDYFHVNAEGADILSSSFARFFSLYAAGKDVSSLFYASQEEYLASIDYITNVYVSAEESGEERLIRAGCNRGSSVEPEYRFCLVDEDGTETVVQDYSSGSTCKVHRDRTKGAKLRVYARPRGSAQDPEVYTEYAL